MMEEKYRKLLLKINNIKDKETLLELQEALSEDSNFINFLENTKDFTHEEHDGLLKLLDLPKNETGYYIDKYGRGVSYNGNRSLKRSGTELNLNKLHKIELNKCKDDFLYFRYNYCFIMTKNGRARPESRSYQKQLEETLKNGEDAAILFSRQSGKTVSTSTYLLWLFTFRENPTTIGIVANKASGSKEVLDKIKKILLELPIWLMPNIEVWNKTQIESESENRILTDVPSSDSFRGFTVNVVYGDEIAYIPSTIWDEFTDSIFPTQNSLQFKQTILTSTANGMNHWKQIVDGARNGINGYTLIENDWREVPHYDKKGNLLDPETYRSQTIKRFGEKFFAQTEENEFLGSSDTLLSGETLKRLQAKKPIKENTIIKGIKIYEEPKKNNHYIISVDPAKDGLDSFAIQVINITKFPFEQVASAKLDIDYLMMPENIEELGYYYNEAFIVIENNEGAGQSIADMLNFQYEYPNLYRDRDNKDTGYKKFPGFRTTTKTRPAIINMMRIFIEEGKLIINDEDTIKEFYNFIKKSGKKYEAEEGYHDDMVMALAISFAPFLHLKAYDDLGLFLSALRVDSNEIEDSTELGDFYSMLESIGGVDDGTDDVYSREDILENIRNSIDIDERLDAVDLLNKMY